MVAPLLQIQNPTIMKASASTGKANTPKKEGSPATQSSKELKTDFPISEKDEIKKAEDRMRKHIKETK
jgi:hypothetical protein